MYTSEEEEDASEEKDESVYELRSQNRTSKWK